MPIFLFTPSRFTSQEKCMKNLERTLELSFNSFHSYLGAWVVHVFFSTSLHFILSQCMSQAPPLGGSEIYKFRRNGHCEERFFESNQQHFISVSSLLFCAGQTIVIYLVFSLHDATNPLANTKTEFDYVFLASFSTCGCNISCSMR